MPIEQRVGCDVPVMSKRFLWHCLAIVGGLLHSLDHGPSSLGQQRDVGAFVGGFCVVVIPRDHFLGLETLAKNLLLQLKPFGRERIAKSQLRKLSQQS